MIWKQSHFRVLDRKLGALKHERQRRPGRRERPGDLELKPLSIPRNNYEIPIALVALCSIHNPCQLALAFKRKGNPITHIATATYTDTWAGELTATLVPYGTRQGKRMYRWITEHGALCNICQGGHSSDYAVILAMRSARFSNVAMLLR